MIKNKIGAAILYKNAANLNANPFYGLFISAYVC